MHGGAYWQNPTQGWDARTQQTACTPPAVLALPFFGGRSRSEEFAWCSHSLIRLRVRHLRGPYWKHTRKIERFRAVGSRVECRRGDRNESCHYQSGPAWPSRCCLPAGPICPEAKAFGRNRERLVLPTLRKSNSRAKYHARVLSEVWVKQVRTEERCRDKSRCQHGRGP